MEEMWIALNNDCQNLGPGKNADSRDGPWQTVKINHAELNVRVEGTRRTTDHSAAAANSRGSNRMFVSLLADWQVR